MTRQLDALVAKMVIGLRESDIYYWTGPWGGERVRHISTQFPEYSDDIAAAFDALNKVTQADEYEPTIAKIEGPFADGWGVTISWLHHDGDIDDERQGGPTLPIAICRAALARVGVPQAEIDAAMEATK